MLPKVTGGSHCLTYHPGYCFLPSFEADKGTVHVFNHLPEFLRDFLFCSEILDISMSDVTKSGMKYGDKSSVDRMSKTRKWSHGGMSGGYGSKSLHGIGQGASPEEKGGHKNNKLGKNQSGLPKMYPGRKQYEMIIQRKEGGHNPKDFNGRRRKTEDF